MSLVKRLNILSDGPKSTSYLSDSQFLQIVDKTPLVSIDLVVLHKERVLLGKRLNRPAQDFWFVPGGRIRKGECLTDAYQRLTKNELGIALNYEQATLLGVYEHFYCDSVFGEAPSTHYIAMGMSVELAEPLESLPKDQHGSFSWWSVQQALESLDVHPYTKDYLHSLS